jgi:predicted RNase H-like nuclease (RuvC/YqgF family)
MKRLKIELVLGALAILLASSPLTATPTPKPTPTPTSAPRKLGGGFGRGVPDAVATPAVTAVAGDGQSLGQVVRDAGRARKRRETRPPVSITNETLVTDPKKGRLTTASPQPTPQAAPQAAAPSAEAGTVLPLSSEAEAYWRERVHSARLRVEELAERVRQFEQEAKKLESDFYSWDDGAYRDGVIKPAWDKKREELETAKRELEQAEKDRAELPEKARKAGALPGWLRE